MKRGFTLVEGLLASSILALLAQALFEGIIVATRVTIGEWLVFGT